MACRSTFLGGVWLALALCAAPQPCRADPVKADLSVATAGGYARLVFDLSEAVESEVRKSGSVLIITFKQPVALEIGKLAAQAPGYVATARRDPDGKGFRLALARKVTVNSMTAGEKLFVDLMPEEWTGAPPGLPQNVVEDLARRAREAERLLRVQQQASARRKVAAVRVHVASQPTFTRYTFDIPEEVAVAADHGKDRLTLTFDAPVKFDLADAKASLPAAIEAIEAEPDQGATVVRFGFLAKVDVRTFRENKGFVVDVLGTDAKPQPRSEAENSAPGEPVLEALKAAAANAPAPKPPQTVPATPEMPAAPAREVPAAPAEKPEPAKPAVAAPAPAPAPERPAAVENIQRKVSEGTVAVELTRHGENLNLAFPFPERTSAAVFRRADSLWIVFDSNSKFDLSALTGDTSRTIRGAEVTHAPDGDIVRIRLERPRLSSVAVEGPVWNVTIGETVLEPTRSLGITRNLIGPNRASLTIPFEEPRHLHRISDPDIGDSLLVVTAYGPARGFLKTQEFVELRALASTHGVVLQPLADDLNAELTVDKIVVARPGGLSLSTSLASLRRASSGLRPVMFDSQLWGFDRQAAFSERQAQLVRLASEAPAGKRLAPRVDLARFYLARDLFPEAKAVLDVVLGENRPAAEEASAFVLRAVAEVMMNRPEDALRDLATPTIGNLFDAPLWRAVAQARQGKWAQARGGFKSVEAAMATLPVELQRLALKDSMRAAIEIGDFASAANQLNDFDTIGVPRELQPAISVLSGRLAEGLGRSEDALAAYRTAADSWNRPAAAQGRLRETVLRYSLGELTRVQAIAELETLTTIWRGDETEVEALQLLGRLYTEEGRYRDSFYVMRSAMSAHPDSEMTRRIQEAAAATFDSLFLAGKGDAMPAIEAVSLFYDFRELTPIGRRGDEMIRRLADRLVSVDLLDQAAELLQHQVDHRLQGAARAQVATRLAVVYLMNRKPDRALATLKATRTADLSNELRNQRLLLEGRALSDLGRQEVALEVIGNIEGREAIRLRSDIDWAARHWRKSAEQLELLYGERWKEWQPLGDIERADIMRAAIGYALGEDKLGLGRFREKYAAKMAEGADARAFEIVTSPNGASGAEFGEIARTAASVDTLDGFLRDLHARFPETGAMPPSAPPATPVAAPAPPVVAPAPPATAPAAAPVATPAPAPPAVAASPPPKPSAPQTKAADPSPTGSISRTRAGAGR